MKKKSAVNVGRKKGKAYNKALEGILNLTKQGKEDRRKSTMPLGQEDYCYASEHSTGERTNVRAKKNMGRRRGKIGGGLGQGSFKGEKRDQYTMRMLDCGIRPGNVRAMHTREKGGPPHTEGEVTRK